MAVPIAQHPSVITLFEDEINSTTLVRWLSPVGQVSGFVTRIYSMSLRFLVKFSHSTPHHDVCVET